MYCQLYSTPAKPLPLQFPFCVVCISKQTHWDHFCVFYVYVYICLYHFNVLAYLDMPHMLFATLFLSIHVLEEEHQYPWCVVNLICSVSYLF